VIHPGIYRHPDGAGALLFSTIFASTNIICSVFFIIQIAFNFPCGALVRRFAR
jgi:hypothetical protein